MAGSSLTVTTVATQVSPKSRLITLIVAGALEPVWAVAFGKSEGFTRLTPSVVFFVAIAASMARLDLTSFCCLDEFGLEVVGAAV